MCGLLWWQRRGGGVGGVPLQRGRIITPALAPPDLSRAFEGRHNAAMRKPGARRTPWSRGALLGALLLLALAWGQQRQGSAAPPPQLVTSLEPLERLPTVAAAGGSGDGSGVDGSSKGGDTSSNGSSESLSVGAVASLEDLEHADPGAANGHQPAGTPPTAARLSRSAQQQAAAQQGAAPKCAVYNGVQFHADVAAGLAWAFQVRKGGSGAAC